MISFFRQLFSGYALLNGARFFSIKLPKPVRRSPVYFFTSWIISSPDRLKILSMKMVYAISYNILNHEIYFDSQAQTFFGHCFCSVFHGPRQIKQEVKIKWILRRLSNFEFYILRGTWSNFELNTLRLH